MLILQRIAYAHLNKELLFTNINLTVNNHDKVALIGNNGVGKSTLLKIVAGELYPSEGQVIVDEEPYYVPQIFGQFNHLTIAQALRIDGKLSALKEILSGNAIEENFNLLNDDWDIENRCNEALSLWQLSDCDLSQRMETLSGGQKTKVFLAGISIHQPALILLDEPSNHLDIEARALLYDFIATTRSTLLVVSHDRKLLNLLNISCELSASEIKVYGGNYDFYKNQKQIEQNALNQEIQSGEKALRKAKEKERETAERQQKLDSRGKRKHEKSGVARIMMNTLRSNAENSTAKLMGVHADKVGEIASDLQQLRSSLSDVDKMKFVFDNSALHKGKILFLARAVNYAYDVKPLWDCNLTLQITSGERIALRGANGSGKTTLIRLILGELEPSVGEISRAYNKVVYIDQDYSLINNELSVYEQAEQFNDASQQEHQVKIELNRFFCSQKTIGINRVAR